MTRRITSDDIRWYVAIGSRIYPPGSFAIGYKYLSTVVFTAGGVAKGGVCGAWQCCGCGGSSGRKMADDTCSCSTDWAVTVFVHRGICNGFKFCPMGWWNMRWFIGGRRIALPGERRHRLPMVLRFGFLRLGSTTVAEMLGRAGI